MLSNVAIASAVTSYGRIHMMSVKDMNCCYSWHGLATLVITTVPLDPSLMGTELGLFKDELNGSTISQGIFLGIKQFGFIIDGNEKSVFAGVPRNTINFEELKAIGDGATLKREVGNKFYKSLNKEVQLDQNIITLDLETYQFRKDSSKVGWGLRPYLIAFYDGAQAFTSYITDFNPLLRKRYDSKLAYAIK